MRNNSDTLFIKCQYLRLTAELAEVDAEMAENAPLEVSEEDNLGEKLVKRTKNALFRDSKTKGLSEKRDRILANIEKFKEKNPKLDIERITDEDLQRSLASLFKRDRFDVNRELLGVSIILDGEYEYVLTDAGLKKLSSLLYEDEGALFEIKRSLEKLYTDIRKKPLKPEKAMLGTVGIAILTLYTAAIAGIAAGAASIAGGTILGTVSAYLVGGTLIGATYVTLNETKRRKIKAEFAKLSLDESASLLAIRCHIISKVKKSADDRHVKDEISDLLSLTDDLRSDVSYELFVENEDVESNKAKLAMFHNFDNALSEILT